ncbi:MAG: tyrosine-type recombinase/integrase [Okeania sp. SIO2F4]|uniref:tyrosine-type recombinase/integrase n=1 Tax=Okeania sp. SIO2F4 TaxID=2607790 RepID=UPI00142945E3|nr:tyrosine-type recombinase/integrase [Okeania sp. SIO2F4]NES01999.1 tyrosine-type recombinase/integrase [Okeania sp. SIO2F4]
MTKTLAQVTTKFIYRDSLSKSTKLSYEVTLMPLLEKFGSYPIEIINRKLIEDYLTSLTHLSYTTCNRHQTIIQSLFNFAVEKAYIKVNPATGIRQQKPNRSKGEHQDDSAIRYLTNEQLETLYQLVEPDIRLHTIVRLLHRTGARISELLSLNLEDINRDNCKFQVVGKGNKKRWCFYSKDAAILLEKYIQYYRHKPHKALFTARHPLTEIVTRLSYHRVYSLWREVTNQSPILTGVRLHDLRHTFATERVGLMGIEELRALMGHSHIQTTLKYQKVTSLRAEQVAQNALQILLKND